MQAMMAAQTLLRSSGRRIAAYLAALLAWRWFWGMLMNVLVRGTLVLPALLLLAGCEDLITGGDLIRPGEPTGAIEVVNATSYIIDVVLISGCEVVSYGLNRLPDGGAIGPGGSYAFEVTAGCWDVDAGSIAAAGEARQRVTVDAGGVARYTVHD